MAHDPALPTATVALQEAHRRGLGWGYAPVRLDYFGYWEVYLPCCRMTPKDAWSALQEWRGTSKDALVKEGWRVRQVRVFPESKKL